MVAGAWSPDVADSCLFWAIQSQYVHLIQVILSDGGLPTLANMKLNLELNQLSAETDVPERFGEDPNKVRSRWSCISVTIFLSSHCYFNCFICSFSCQRKKYWIL